MLKKFALALTLLMVAAVGMAQHTPGAQMDRVWQQGLNPGQVRIVERIADRKNATDRWMLYTAVVRTREASEDVFPGERLDNLRILAMVRVRMTLDESNKWTRTWNRLSAGEQSQMLAVFRQILRQ
jgi:hypothetical protein